ncbi:MAG: hypothetical protein AAGF12_35300 [Myxococcota bacterium]
MFSLAVDEHHGVCLLRFSGPTNSAADWSAFLDFLSNPRTLELSEHPSATVIQLVDRGNPPPDASLRRKIGELAAKFPPHLLFIFATESSLVRGSLTAVLWLFPRDFPTRVCRNYLEAMAIATEERGFRKEALERLLNATRPAGAPG